MCKRLEVNERFQKGALEAQIYREVLESENVSLSNKNVGKNPTTRKRKVFIEVLTTMKSVDP